jgi:hypothetical protein
MRRPRARLTDTGFAMTPSAIRMLGLALALACLAACVRSEQGPAGFRFTNQTDDPLRIVYIAPDGTEREDDPIIHELQPGTSVVASDRFVPNDCMDGSLVARDLSGWDVVRRNGPICRPGEWMIRPSP